MAALIFAPTTIYARDWLDLIGAIKSYISPTASTSVKVKTDVPPKESQTPAKSPEPGKGTAQTAGGTGAQGSTTTGGATGTPVQTVPPQTQTPVQQPAPQPPPQKSGLINNVFSGTDIREAFAEVAAAAGVTIIPDDSIKQTTVSIEFKNEPLESAIDKLALTTGAYWKKRADGIYLITQGTPESSLFREFSETANYTPQNETAASLQLLLPANYKAYVQADPKSNLITVTAPSQLLPRILADLVKIDAPVRQFVVEALVTELTNEGTNDFGFSWSWKNFALGDDLGLSYAKAGFADVAKLKALIVSRKATLRANPRLTAFEGRESTLTVGQETYFSILTGNVQFPTAQIQLIKTGVTLNFTGYIAADNTITLNLSPEVSDAVVSVNGNPTTNVRRVSTMVRVKPGETIAIGGLVQETSNHTINRIPILSSIPLIGELFKTRSDDNKRTEVIILITPHLSEGGAGSLGIDSGRPKPG